MNTLNDMPQHKQQQLARNERQLALQKIKKRKADTRCKIELGGLIIKAGMSDYSKAVILGALMSVAEDLASDDAYTLLFQSKGETAFMES